MTMADPREGDSATLTLVLKLEPAEPVGPEDELTCLFCGGPRVEWETTLRLGGCTKTVGVHERCGQRLRFKP